MSGQTCRVILHEIKPDGVVASFPATMIQETGVLQFFEVFEGGPDMDRPVMTQQMAGANFVPSNEERIVHWSVATDHGVYRYGVEATDHGAYEAIWAQLGEAGAACAATAETAAPIDKVCAREGCAHKCPTARHAYCSPSCQKMVAAEKEKQRLGKAARKYLKRRTASDEDKLTVDEKAAYVQAAASTFATAKTAKEKAEKEYEAAAASLERRKTLARTPNDDKKAKKRKKRKKKRKGGFT
jgi:hypothetical protein